MIKTISKIGNSQGIILDAALLQLMRLKIGDQVSVTVHDGGSITFTPVRSVVSPGEAASAARRLIKKNSEVFRRLA